MSTFEARQILEEVLNDYLDDESSQEIADLMVDRLTEEGFFDNKDDLNTEEE